MHAETQLCGRSPDSQYVELAVEVSRRALRASRRLVQLARDAGAVRSDFDESDLYLLLQANAGLVKATQRSAPNAWKRFGQYMLQSFREQNGDLEPPSPTWMRAGGINDPH